jgi:hypothetical protein
MTKLKRTRSDRTRPLTPYAQLQQEWQNIFFDPGADPEDVDDAYLAWMRPTLSKTANKEYQKLGRGALFINMMLRNSDGLVDTWYVTSARLSPWGGWPAEVVGEMVAQYNPEREFVAVTLRPGPDTRAYLVALNLGEVF